MLQPSGKVHSPLPDALDCPIIGRPIPVIVFADGEEALEVIPGAPAP
jgi:hypothetical protein